MAKTLADLYGEVSGSKELLKAFAEAAKAGKVLDFVKANGVEATEEEIKSFSAGKTSDAMLSVDELADAAGGDGCNERMGFCEHKWVSTGNTVKNTRGSISYEKVCTKCGAHNWVC